MIGQLLRRIVFQEHRNAFVIIAGKPQSGKSSLALKIALEVDPDFDLENHFAIGQPSEFFRVLKVMPRKRGEVRVLDEAGVGASSRRFMSRENVNLSAIHQTEGVFGRVTILVAPYVSLIDRHQRMMADLEITTLPRDVKNNKIRFKAEMVQHNAKLGKTYYHGLRAVFPDGRRRRVKSWKYSMPPADRLERYHERANAFKAELTKQLWRDSQAAAKAEDSASFDADYYVEKVAADPERYISEHNKRRYLKKDLIAAEFGLGGRRAGLVKAKAEKRLEGVV